MSWQRKLNGETSVFISSLVESKNISPNIAITKKDFAKFPEVL
jgi:hypothetical protein